MRLASYNVLNPYHAVKWATPEGLTAEGLSNWSEGRGESVIANLRAADADALCLQEVSPQTLRELAGALGHVAVAVHALHPAGEPDEANGVAVLYRPAALELLGTRIYELSGRAAASADVRCRATQRVTRVVAVHLSGYNPIERDQTLRRDGQRVGDEELEVFVACALADPSEAALDGIALAGDLNEGISELSRPESRVSVMTAKGFSWDGTLDVTYTRTGNKIDWVFYRPLTPAGRARLTHAEFAQDPTASDHAATASDVTF